MIQFYDYIKNFLQFIIFNATLSQSTIRDIAMRKKFSLTLSTLFCIEASYGAAALPRAPTDKFTIISQLKASQINIAKLTTLQAPLPIGKAGIDITLRDLIDTTQIPLRTGDEEVFTQTIKENKKQIAKSETGISRQEEEYARLKRIISQETAIIARLENTNEDTLKGKQEELKQLEVKIAELEPAVEDNGSRLKELRGAYSVKVRELEASKRRLAAFERDNLQLLEKSRELEARIKELSTPEGYTTLFKNPQFIELRKQVEEYAANPTEEDAKQKLVVAILQAYKKQEMRIKERILYYKRMLTDQFHESSKPFLKMDPLADHFAKTQDFDFSIMQSSVNEWSKNEELQAPFQTLTGINNRLSFLQLQSKEAHDRIFHLDNIMCCLVHWLNDDLNDTLKRSLMKSGTSTNTETIKTLRELVDNLNYVFNQCNLIQRDKLIVMKDDFIQMAQEVRFIDAISFLQYELNKEHCKQLEDVLVKEILKCSTKTFKPDFKGWKDKADACLKEFRAEIAKLEAEHISLKEQQGKLEAEARSLEQEIRPIEKQMKELEAKKAEANRIRKEVAKIEEFLKHNYQKDKIEDELAEHQKQFETVKSELSSSRGQLEQEKKRLFENESILSEMRKNEAARANARKIIPQLAIRKDSNFTELNRAAAYLEIESRLEAYFGRKSEKLAPAGGAAADESASDSVEPERIDISSKTAIQHLHDIIVKNFPKPGSLFYPLTSKFEEAWNIALGNTNLSLHYPLSMKVLDRALSFMAIFQTKGPLETIKTILTEDPRSLPQHNFLDEARSRSFQHMWKHVWNREQITYFINMRQSPDAAGEGSSRKSPPASVTPPPSARRSSTTPPPAPIKRSPGHSVTPPAGQASSSVSSEIELTENSIKNIAGQVPALSNMYHMDMPFSKKDQSVHSFLSFTPKKGEVTWGTPLKIVPSFVNALLTSPIKTEISLVQNADKVLLKFFFPLDRGMPQIEGFDFEGAFVVRKNPDGTFTEPIKMPLQGIQLSADLDFTKAFQVTFFPY